ncbi:Ferric reductase NAD binding domain [Geosmithia morbida]|uniref:Ferric reductase NAD binding domain n=1 Tax=Geosmithia morbida TaxID=1094350 RepID=A0A9P5D1W4_9HYPO|nr:Ferric reductase NAD binding domain [Geosmithia morbida]KAF4120886.1 Ferric reductase NAD binding domain [Geosmithia morbida]
MDAAAHSMVHHVARHIQEHTSDTVEVPHWGYASRVVPCTNDAGSCEYLDVVYSSHDVGMVYMGILWLTILGVIFGWAILRHVSRPTATFPSEAIAKVVDQSDEEQGQSQTRQRSSAGGLSRVLRSAGALARRHLLPDSIHAIFGRTSRFQVVALAAFTAYLTIWTFVGITYKTWMTPVSGSPGLYNQRSSLGPWSDRLGVIAYALTPLSIILVNRESMLSVLLGVPYQSFNFLHRWVGYLIFVQSGLHTIGWCIIELNFYQPQPRVGIEWVSQGYMIWGIVAMFLLTVLFLLSTPWGIRLTGYEAFRKMHYVLAMVYMAACYCHWSKLRCFIIPGFVFWGLDRVGRLARSFLLHYTHIPSGGMAFRPAQAAISVFPDEEHGHIVRLDIENDQDAWTIGQHFYLTFTESSIWQSHPFTPINAPIVRNGKVHHTYIMRAKGGETKKLADLAMTKVAGLSTGEKDASSEGGDGAIATTPVIFTGPYGEKSMSGVTPTTNIMCIAGGTGIAYVLPVLLELARQPLSPTRRVELIWAVRHANDAAWVQSELDELRRIQNDLNLKIRLYATRDASASSSSSAAGDISNTDDSDSERKIGKTADSKNVNVTSSSSSVADSSSPNPGCGCGDGNPLPVRKTGNPNADDDVRHPDLDRLVRGFVESTADGPTTVFASGPGSMITSLRSIVASCNSPSMVWAGKERGSVRLMCDDRLEW